MTTHMDAHVESQGLCEMTSPLKQPAAEDALDKAGSCGGSVSPSVCICVCARGDVMSAGVGLALP